MLSDALSLSARAGLPGLFRSRCAFIVRAGVTCAVGGALHHFPIHALALYSS